MMLGTTNIKFIDAQQAKLAYQYKNTKRKLYKTNAAIWYNKTCRQKRLTPKYSISISVSMATTNNAKKHTKQQSISASTRKLNTYILRNRNSTRSCINTPYNVTTVGETSGIWYKSKAIAENKNAIVASCWTYFTTIKHDARNHKY